jgi:hypothetical protein
LRPTLDTRDAIAGEDRRIVMEQQSFAQGQLPTRVIGVNAMPGEHLRLRLEPGVKAKQLIVDRVAVQNGGYGRGRDRIH